MMELVFFVLNVLKLQITKGMTRRTHSQQAREGAVIVAT